MIESVREDILKILEGIEKIMIKGRFEDIKKLSDHTIHSASIFQDDDSTSIAVVTYALSKVLMSSKPPVIDEIKENIISARKNLKKKDYSAYKINIKNLFKTIASLNAKLKQYVEEVIQYAEIKKGARVYEHGISMARAAEVLGVSEWDLMRYIGRTTLIDAEEPDEKERLSFTRKMFGLKK